MAMFRVCRLWIQMASISPQWRPSSTGYYRSIFVGWEEMETLWPFLFVSIVLYRLKYSPDLLKELL